MTAPSRAGAAVLVAVVALAGCDRKPKTAEERGAGIFLRTCSGCHGPHGGGSNRPGFKNPPRDLTDPDLHRSMSDEELKRVIRTGKGQMPAFGRLIPEEDLADLIVFLRTLDSSREQPSVKSRR